MILNTEDEQMRMELYNEGLLDREIALGCQVSHESIRIWRLTRGLPSHSNRTGRPPTDRGVNIERIKEEYGRTDVSLKELCTKYHLSYGWLYPRLAKLNCKMKSKGWKARKSVKLYPSENLSYILGVLRGDGYVWSTRRGQHWIGLTTIDQDFASIFKSSLEKIGLYCRTRIRKSRNPLWHDRYVVEAHSVDFVEKYSSLTPKEIRGLVTSYHSKIAFIRGFYDSEGSICIKGNGHDLRMGCTNEQTTMFIFDLVRSMGYNFHLYRYPSQNPKWKPMVHLVLSKKEDVHRFLSEIRPNVGRKATCPCKLS